MSDKGSTRVVPEPGIHQDIPFEEYVEWDAVNNSSLTRAARSMAHYRYAPPQAETKALRFGKLCHSGALEPLLIPKHYVVMPDLAEGIRRADGTEYASPRATAEYKRRAAEFKEANADKEVVDQDTYDTMMGVVDALLAHERAREYLYAPDPSEVSIVWDDPETGIRCKGRIDRLQLRASRLSDLKTTIDASQFERSVFRFAYHRQGAFYVDGMRVLTGEDFAFALVAVERDKPFGVRAAPLHSEALVEGRIEYRRLLRAIAQARQTGEWKGYEDPDCWRLPAYASSSQSADLVIGGQTVAL